MRRGVLVPTLLKGGGDWLLLLDGARPALDIDFQNDRAYSAGALAAITSLLTCSRSTPSTSRYEQADGTFLKFSANVLRYGDRGMLIEAGRTNALASSSHRDLTNAAWTPTDVTVAKDQTGADGDATSASSITATADNGTVLQAITLASSARATSASVKRLTGSGTLDMTTDGGSTWVTPKLANGGTWDNTAAGWKRIVIPAQTLANPSVGFRIGTSGDAFAVDLVQNENGSEATSPIGGGETRASETVNANGLVSGLLDADALTIYARANQYNASFVDGPILNFRKASSGIGDRIGLHTGANSTTRPRFQVVASTVASVDISVGSQAAYARGTTYRFAASVDVTSGICAVDGVEGVSDSSVTLPTGLDTLDFGTRAASTPLNGFIERVTMWKQKTAFIGGVG